ncbi:hypothetical protein NM208_g1623 [Fusarium decemcellulare]|uniref:Uncharacterized protein n=1 Tax=Fusarium decemcellulare TaxID=57161 RepID=A0ACC1SVQ2_9HYPO|nr:hypothetical protein NM208_g1623 [Fusarium decemcellulare]
MDPVSALGIASASAQFITFASQLISTTAALYDSASDASAYISNLNTVYSQLQKLYRNLNQASHKAARDQATEDQRTTNNRIYHQTPTFDPFLQGEQFNVLDFGSQAGLRTGNIFQELHNVYTILRDVLGSCEYDASCILTIISKLKLEKTAGSLGKSFKAALKMVWKRDEINTVEERLKRSQGVLITIMSRISNIYHIQHSQELAALRRESQLLGARHSEQLSHMQKMLQNIEKDRNSTEDASTVSTELNSLEQMMRQFSLSKSSIRMELDIIRSLNFKTRQSRHDAIPDAHRETFRWVFTSSKNRKSEKREKQQQFETRLLKWLEHGDGVFWVSGKPGSGKSTFMKFVADHPKTIEALSKWSYPHRAVISSCYFWSSGTGMQKSLTGLLQTILHDVFRSCPQMIQDACPSRWTGETLREDKWTQNELRAALGRISAQPEAPFRFCFFIDGLDEYDGDHLDFCDYLETIAHLNIKLCLSSRPWNVFKDAFGGNPASRIFIHELTWDDILLYAEDRLHSHRRWSCLASQAKQAASLAETIAKSAQGVFLWVFLVTKLLREGLTNDDSFNDLKRRLHSFPTELEPFFKQMLESVPSFYHEKMAGALKLALYATKPLNCIIYSYLDDEIEDKNYWQHLPSIDKVSGRESMRRKQIVRRLDARSRGLLEEQLGEIGFLHRTVADFLRTREMSDFLDSRIRKDFNPGISILKAYTAWLKTASLSSGTFMLYEKVADVRDGHKLIRHGDPYRSTLWREARFALKQASYLELDPEASKTTLDSLVDRIDYALNILAGTLDARYAEHYPNVYQDMSRLCRTLVLELPLMGYFSRKLQVEPGFPGESFLGESSISVVLGSDTTWPVACCEKLRLVLEAGSDPNTSIMGAVPVTSTWEEFRSGILPTYTTSIWGEFLSGILPKVLPGGSPGSWNTPSPRGWLDKASPKFQGALEQGLIQAFLDYGADPHLKVQLDSDNVLSIFTLFVAAACDIDWNERAEEMYFKSLDFMIEKGASFDKNDMVGASLRPSGLRETLIESTVETMTEHHEIIRCRLEEKLNFIDEPSEGLFINRLVQKILPCAREAGWPWQNYRHLITRTMQFQKKSPVGCNQVLNVGSKRLLELDGEDRDTKRGTFLRDWASETGLFD